MEGDAQGNEECKDAISEQTANDYSQYLEIDVSRERKHFEESIDDMLTRLEEYLSIVSLIRLDTNLHLGTTLPKVQQKSEEMAKIFEKIDRLEAFVSLVKKNVNTVEELVNKADSDMGSLSSLKKMFTNISMPSFLSRGKQVPKSTNPRPSEQQKKYLPPPIFKTDDYLHLPSPIPSEGNVQSDTQGNTAIADSYKDSEGPSQGASSPGSIPGTWPEIGET